MPNRLIKESIWKSKTLSSLSMGAQNLFFRLLPLPDDHGCFEADAEIIRGRLYPRMLDKVKVKDVEGWLCDLQAVDCIRMWMHADGERYGWFPQWSEHQIIRSLHRRKTPEPPDSVTSLKTGVIASANNCMQLQTIVPLNPNPNYNPNPNKPIDHPGDDLRSDFEQVWSEYPEKKGKEKAWMKFRNQIKTDQDRVDIRIALKNYKDDMARVRQNHPDRAWQHGSTWFNGNWRDYVDYTPPDKPPGDKWNELLREERGQVVQ